MTPLDQPVGRGVKLCAECGAKPTRRRRADYCEACYRRLHRARQREKNAAGGEEPGRSEKGPHNTPPPIPLNGDSSLVTPDGVTAPCPPGRLRSVFDQAVDGCSGEPWLIETGRLLADELDLLAADVDRTVPAALVREWRDVMREILPVADSGMEEDVLERAIESFLASAAGADGVGGQDDLPATSPVRSPGD